MKKLLTILMLLGTLLHVAAVAPAGAQRRKPQAQRPDTTVQVTPQEGKHLRHRRMSTSNHPVQVKVVGNALRVQSPEAQILPIYTENGTFYMIMRLSKGINWLGGLPRGKYYINHRLVTIK